MPRVEPQTKKTRRGKRNLKTAERLTEKWVESGGLDRVLKKIQSSTRTTNIPQYPDQFLRIRGREQVADTLARVFPSLMLDQLKLEPQDGRLMYPTPSCDGLKSLHSPYLAARFHDVLKRPEQTALIAAWDALNTLDVRYPKPELQRSKVPALHVGIWENYRLLPIISSDAQDQAPDVIIAMDIFLSLVGKFIAPRLGNLLYRYFPQQYSRQERAHARVSILLRAWLKKRPALDFGGSFFVVAVKEGSSEILHIDFNDDPNSVSWVIPLGDWTGGEFCLPQLGVKIPVRPGQALAVMTKTLVHCTTPITKGRRIILTLFSDRTLLKHGDEFLNVPVIDYSP